MRRRRFIITLVPHDLGDQRQVEVLGYTADSVRNYYERAHGHRYRVDHVVPKPRARKGESSAAFRPAWSFDLRAIQAAFEAMTSTALPAGLKFEYGRRGARRRGCFEWGCSGSGADACLHSLAVRVRRDLSPAQANRTLWHELAHVAQYVRCPDDATYLREHYAERRARYGYRNRPCEREAREWEHLAETDWLLDGERRGSADNDRPTD